MTGVNLKSILSGIGLLFLHPLTLSSFVTTFILLLFPITIPKYQLKVEEKHVDTERAVRCWADLDQDGNSDGILFTNYKIGFAVVTVQFAKGSVKEWNIPGKLVDAGNNNFFAIQESGKDQKAKLFLLTKAKDSLFLNAIDDFSSFTTEWKQKYLAKYGIKNNSDDVFPNPFKFSDLDGDGQKELIFGISSGFSITPRSIFVYDLQNDTIFRSIETGNFVEDYLIADINGDNRKEVATFGYAPRNILDTVVKYHDSSIWNMVFDHRLNLMATPTEFPGHTTTSAGVLLKSPDKSEIINTLRFSPFKNEVGLQLYRIDRQGRLDSIKEFTEFDELSVAGAKIVLANAKRDRIIIPLSNGTIYLYDPFRDDLDKITIENDIGQMFSFDVDLDGENEFILFDQFRNSLCIYRSDFKHPATIPINIGGSRFTTLSIKKENKKLPMLAIQSGPYYYLLSYERNPLWYLQPALWLSIWIAILLFVIAIRKIQRIQDEKRFAAEKKITELQMKVVRNQMDPHFTMNAINAVIDAINREEKEEARENLLHFSKMYRSLVLSADKIKRTLREELEFTENYLALERFRFNNRFSYEIEIDPLVDLSWEVPKMVIQSPVENAVKHGLLTKETGGKVVIRAFRDEGHLVLEISDNGIGRKASSGQSEGSTGKGLQIMEQFFELYRKTTGVEVKSSIASLENSETGATGTRVTTMIQLKLQSGR